jgi:hypothetical protein
MLAVFLLKFECPKSARIVDKPAEIGKIAEQFQRAFPPCNDRRNPSRPAAFQRQGALIESLAFLLLAYRKSPRH